VTIELDGIAFVPADPRRLFVAAILSLGAGRADGTRAVDLVARKWRSAHRNCADFDERPIHRLCKFGTSCV